MYDGGEEKQIVFLVLIDYYRLIRFVFFKFFRTFCCSIKNSKVQLFEVLNSIHDKNTRMRAKTHFLRNCVTFCVVFSIHHQLSSAIISAHIRHFLEMQNFYNFSKNFMIFSSHTWEKTQKLGFS